MSASETPKSRLETRSFPPVSTPAPPPPPAAPLKPLNPLSNMSCCHLSGSCFGCNRRKRTHLLTSGSPCLCQSQSTRLGVGASRGSASNRARVLNSPPTGSPVFPAHPIHYKQVNQFRQKDIHRRHSTSLYSRCINFFFLNNWV